jgi:hypothetical protein
MHMGTVAEIVSEFNHPSLKLRVMNKNYSCGDSSGIAPVFPFNPDGLLVRNQKFETNIGKIRVSEHTFALLYL